MKVLLCVFTVIFCWNKLLAQDTTTFFIKAGTNINDAISKTAAFYYPQFKQGRVYFKSGGTSQAKMNYNTLLDEIHFVDQKGDTLAIDDELTIKFITIDKDSFYYDRGYVMVLQYNNGVKLAAKHIYRVIDQQKIGGYNMPNPTSSIVSYSSYFDGKSLYNLTVKEDIYLKKTTLYYIGNKNNQFASATKKNVLSLFPKHEKQITAFLKDNQIDFDKRSDLDGLVQFLSQL